MGFPPDVLLSDEKAPTEQSRLAHIIKQLAPEELIAAQQVLEERFGKAGARSPNKAYIALIGLRGAGKTTLGRRLALHRGVPFFELDREVEREYGATIGEILALHGQPGYRRFERQSLLTVIARNPSAVIETGGGLAADPDTLPLLLENTLTVWVKASPEEHMQRVIDQGDLRPMARTRQAMREVTGPIVATALVLSAVFIPTAFISGLTGQFYKQFAITIAISIVILHIGR